MVSLEEFFKGSKCILEFDIGTYTIEKFDKIEQSIKIISDKAVQLNKVTIVSNHNDSKKINYMAYIDYVYDYNTTDINENKIMIDKFDHNYFNSTVTMYFVFNYRDEYFKTYHYFYIQGSQNNCPQ